MKELHELAGRDYRGTLSVGGLNAAGAKTTTIDMTHAYADKTLASLVRRFTMAEDGSVERADTYAFRRKPRALEEAFITFEPVRIAGGGRAAIVGRGRRKLVLAAPGTRGKFAAARLVEESKDARGDAIVTRITFVPSKLERQMTLAFTMR